MDQWRLTYEEYQKYTSQFAGIKPVQGFVTGEQARVYFLQFGLPAPLLAQIWNLSDLTSDGKLDRREFCIAMHLIGKSLAGRQLPVILPDSLKVEPAPAGFSGPFAPAVPFGGPAAPVVPSMVPAMVAPTTVSAAPASSKNVQRKTDWTIPSQSRLKYSQAFNSIDKNRSGFLSGVQARNILTQSGLPTQTLAQLWNLADMDKDGRLSSDEYCVAMFLVEKLKNYEISALPATLPPETLTALPGRQRTVSISSLGAPDFEPFPDDTFNSESQFAATFEDRRRENFDKGLAELERRRQILLEQEKREKDERDRKEREGAAKLARERLEAERKYQAQMELAMAKQREEEARREEEYRKVVEQREAARRELEKQRQTEFDKQRLHDLIAQRQNEQESVGHLKQKQKHLQFQLQNLSEKTAELDNCVTDVRVQIGSVTSSIELMKKERDAKVLEIDSTKRQIQELNSLAAQNLLELKSLGRQQSSIAGGSAMDAEGFSAARRQKSLDLENLRLALADSERQMEQHSAAGNPPKASHLRAIEECDAETTQNRQLIDKIKATRQKVAQRCGSVTKQFAADDDVPSIRLSSATAKFRALYEFEARSADELSFQPGDVLLVFKSHVGEPGWLAGQIKDKVGWFPEAFAEPMDAAPVTDPFTDSSPQHAMTRLESINEESSEKDLESSLQGQNPSGVHANGSTNGQPRTAVAQFLWKAKKDNHLTFNKGDVINVLEMQEMWWMGELNGQSGWFPKSYVKLSESGDFDRRKSETSLVDKQSRDKVKLLTKKFDSQEFPSQADPFLDGGSKTVKAPAGVSHADPFGDHSRFSMEAAPSGGQWYVAVYPFPEMEPGDLKFEAGEKIFVTRKEGEWWTGECGGRLGMFPANYVEPAPFREPSVTAKNSIGSTDEYASIVKRVSVKSLERTPSVEPTSPTSSGHHDACEVVRAIAPFKASGANQLSLEEGDLVKIRAKSPTGWWEGELQQKNGQTNGKHAAEKKVGWFPGNYVAALDKRQIFQGQKSTSKSSMRLADGQCETAVVTFDYAAQQNDELTLSRGDFVVVLEKIDEDWWQGETPDGRRGLFPASYVQPASGADRGSSLEQVGENPGYSENGQAGVEIPQEPTDVGKMDERAATKRTMCCQELLQTEHNFADDLQMVRQVFYKQLQEGACLTATELRQLFLNWEDLIKGSKVFFKTLKQHGEDRIGSAILQSGQIFDYFLIFCRDQQSSLDLLESKSKNCKKFQTVHNRCSQHPAARGLPLSHFLLIPLTRVTKYPLVLKEILKHTPENHPDKSDLVQSLEFLKHLCEKVDRLASETQNLQMLHWCQNHVKCDGLVQPKLLFHSETNCSGWRKILHSGVLFKAKSSRLLIGLLFNDLLIFTTPDESIDKPMDFKLTRHSDLTLSLYKQPILLRKANLQLAPNLTGVDPGDDTLLSLNTGDSSISLKALSSNNRLLWTKQLEKAMKQAKEDYANQTCPLTPEGSNCNKIVAGKATLGRLLLDVVSLRNLHIPAHSKSCPLFLVLTLGQAQRFVKRIDCTNESVRGDFGFNFGSAGAHAPANALVSTQFLIENIEASFDLKVFLEYFYTPNVSLGRAQLSVEDMLRMSGSHKNPAIKQLPLWPLDDPCPADRTTESPGGHVVIKFVVQMLDMS